MGHEDFAINIVKIGKQVVGWVRAFVHGAVAEHPGVGYRQVAARAGNVGYPILWVKARFAWKYCVELEVRVQATSRETDHFATPNRVARIWLVRIAYVVACIIGIVVGDRRAIYNLNGTVAKIHSDGKIGGGQIESQRGDPGAGFYCGQVDDILRARALRDHDGITTGYVRSFYARYNIGQANLVGARLWIGMSNCTSRGLLGRTSVTEGNHV